MADQLATPEDLASLLQQDLDRSTAELLIECATAVVQNAVGGQRILLVEDDEVTLYTDQYDDPLWLTLPQKPIVSVGAVTIGGSAVLDWSPYFGRNQLYRGYGWGSDLAFATEPSVVTVTYTHGYATDDQRLQLARSAVLLLASQGYDNPTGASREAIDDYSIQYAEMAGRMETTPPLVTALRRQYGGPPNSVRLIKARGA